jgi:biopolymer transport protein ExbD
MAQKRRFLDVWLVDSNTVYREVPYDVVTDWVQQSRLLPDDMLRPSGTAQWFKVGESPEFSPFLPRPEAIPIEDEATALEPVHLDFGWKKRREDPDDDVDMIPLIDVAMVLLVFFMLTSTVGGGLAGLEPPPAFNGKIIGRGELLFINIGLVKGQVPPERFSISVADTDPTRVPREDRDVPREDRDLLSPKEVAERLRDAFKGRTKEVGVAIRARAEVESGVISDMLVELTELGFNKFIAVSGKDQAP